MKAVVVDAEGGPDVLRLTELPVPDPGAGEVRIRVQAAGTNPVDAGNRADASWAGVTPPFVPGYDVAGDIDTLGSAVVGLAVGTRVMALTPFPTGQGGYAEYVVVPAEAVAPIAATTSYVQAAATPLAGGTADDVLSRLDLPPGARLLVLGASGGVGSYLLQLARLGGLQVTAVGSVRHHDRLLERGATSCVDYAQTDAVDVVLSDGQVDAIADLVGGASLTTFLPVVRDGGQVAAIATPELDLDKVLDRNLTFHGVLIDNDGDRTRRLAALLADDSLVADVVQVFPLERAAEAHRVLESGHAGGKVVLTIP